MGKRERRRSREAASVDEMTFSDISEAVEDAIEALLGITDTGAGDCWIQDITDTWAVYQIDGMGEDAEGLWKVGYTMADDGTVTLSGDPQKVETTYTPAAEARDALGGRVREARGTDAQGGRVFLMQIIEAGTSKNLRRYPMGVLQEATPLYEGSKAFDHHRTDEELKTSTIRGLVGQFRNVKTNMAGLEGELHLLPSATHTAEAFDASLEAQSKGYPPLVGISHDVMANYRTATEASGSVQEATKIVRVLSSDVVADPAAGGRAIRMVAAGTEPPSPQEGTVMDLKQLIALLRDADSAKRAELLTEHKALIEAAGLTDGDITKMLIAEPAPVVEPVVDPELVPAGAATESVFHAGSALGKMVIRQAVTDAKLPGDRAVETITKRLGERFTEADLTHLIETAQDMLGGFERDGLTPSVPAVHVGAEAIDKKIGRLDGFFDGKFTESAGGYSSLKAAYIDITGNNPYDRKFSDVDFNRVVMRESIGNMYDSEGRDVQRASESFISSTWSLTLGDSITRRLIAEYKNPMLQTWRQLTSQIVPVSDFRTQRLDRQGEYGALPTVGEGAAYQPLTTPTEEEVTYLISKYGGIEDITLEMIANDDRRVIPRIPQKLARAAGRTIRDFVWNFVKNNATCTFDSVALFDAAHSNTAAVALSNAGMASQTAKMERQTGYDSDVALGLYPRTLVVPPELRELGHELTAGQYAVPSTTPGATNVPNMFQGTTLLVEPYLSDTNDWFLIADPADVPLLEVGFYNGREDPELFSQIDPTQGSMFSADKLTYKIRHIFGAAILDFRGFQRGTQ